MFEKVENYPGDPILSLVEDYQRDSRPGKVNLSIGLYYNQHGRVPEFDAVGAVRKQLSEEAGSPHLYLPMEGMLPYRAAVPELLFGKNHPAVREGRIASIQSLGGSGALKVGADFLRTYFPDSAVWVSDPTWDNHVGIFSGAGFKIHSYPYYDRVTHTVDFEKMMVCLADLPAQAILLLHPCCHNPTGADLSDEQWDEVVGLIKTRSLIPFLDMAYQGFGRGLEQDAYLLKALDCAQVSFLVANSFSKIFSLYGERIGGLSVVCESEHLANKVLGQLKAAVRRNYSSPPVQGAQIVARILNNENLFNSWRTQLDGMRERIRSMRNALVDQLVMRTPEKNFEFIRHQTGMFSFTGLTLAEVRSLRDDHGIYLVDSGRICLAGLNPENIEAVAEAISKISII